MNFLRKAYARVYQGVFRAVMPLLNFREPIILEGQDKIVDVIKDKKVDSVLLVTDKSIRGLGLTKNLEDMISKVCKLTVFDDVLPNPTINMIEEGLKTYIGCGAKLIIAFGGGSVMDCAKIIDARAVRPNLPVRKMKGLLKIRKKLNTLIAIPTTAGTGSETTVAAVITDDETHFKYPINDPCLIPEYACLDASVTLGLPKHITAYTGLDALTHAVEAYIGGSTTKKTRAMSERAVVLIKKYLLRAYVDGSDFEARQGMLKASYYAGVAFTRSYVGYSHSIAHALGGKYGIQHGLANAIILPKLLVEYGKHAEKRLAKLARATGISSGNESDFLASDNFITFVVDLEKKMNIPEFVEELKAEDIPDIAQKADKEGNPLYPVPKLMGRKELEKFCQKLLKK